MLRCQPCLCCPLWYDILSRMGGVFLEPCGLAHSTCYVTFPGEVQRNIYSSPIKYQETKGQFPSGTSWWTSKFVRVHYRNMGERSLIEAWMTQRLLHCHRVPSQQGWVKMQESYTIGIPSPVNLPPVVTCRTQGHQHLGVWGTSW